MARAAVLGRLSWQVGTVATIRDETAAARTITIDLPDWPGHAPGQHVDVRLTAPDGYSAQRSYSIASAPEDGRIELTVQRIGDGEVSPYLTQTLQPGYPLELRGPIGGWFVWDPADPGPVLLLAGGSGIVPIMSMIRTRTQAGRTTPFRVLYSVRRPDAALYAAELAQRQLSDRGLDVRYAYTRVAPPDAGRPPGRIDAALLAEAGFTAGPTAGTAGEGGREAAREGGREAAREGGREAAREGGREAAREGGREAAREAAAAYAADGWPADTAPTVFICGPTAFVEATAGLLVAAGHDAQMIKTERFGPSGG